MANKMKMLFSDAPPDALENLLSPRRKLLYGLFAFGPGTVLGLYLYSVKKRMERENEALRLEEVQSELNIVKERQDKDLVLANAIQEMRDRLRRLEEEATASRQNAAKVTSAASSKADEEKKELPSDISAVSDNKIEAALAVLKSSKQVEEKNSSTWLSTSFEGSQGRRNKRHQEVLQHDVAAHIAKQREQAK